MVPRVEGSSPFTHPIFFDPVAQSAEHLPFKQGVRGSNPRWSTKKTDGQKDRLFSFLIFDENPGHDREIGGCRFRRRADSRFKSKLFARSALKAGVRIPAGAPKKTDGLFDRLFFCASADESRTDDGSALVT